MSPAAVYVHYRSKEELLFELSLAGHRTALNVIEEAAAASSGPAAQLHAVTSAYTAWHARAHTQARVVQYEMAALHPEHTSEIIQIRRTIESHVRAIILAGIESGVFDVRDPRMTTLAILSLGIDVARWYRDDGTWTPEKIGEQYGQFALQLAAYQAG